jgi:nucleoside-diphosphate-sugar epimerase
MPKIPTRARVVITGGCGFLGRYLVETLQTSFSVLSFDAKSSGAGHDSCEGSVTDAARVDRVLEGADALVIAHMAPRAPGVYDSPGVPFDVNVKGTALLLEAAVRHGLRRVVLISSSAVVGRCQLAGDFLRQDSPLCPDSLYGLSKALQEETARYYHAKHGLEVAILRPAYISLGDTLLDKYGRKRESVNWQFVDPRDIGEAVRAALTVDDMGCEAFYLMAGPGAEEKADVAHAIRRLQWKPSYRFLEFARD